MDAISQSSLKSEEVESAHSPLIYEKLHQIFNVSALVILLGGVALLRNKTVDFASMFKIEKHLRPASESLCQ